MTATMTRTNDAHAADDLPFQVQDRRRQGFFTIDNDLYDRFGSELGPYGLATYMGLARFANQESECFPSQSTLAKRAGMSRMQVSREIEKLKSLNLIAVEKQFGRKGEKRANLYILLDLPHVTESDIPCNRELQPHVTDNYIPSNRPLHKQDNSNNNTQEQQDTVQHRRVRRHKATIIPESKKDVVVVLSNFGMSDSVASLLAQHYSRERISEKVEHLKFLQVEDPDKVLNPCGWLRRAVEENWSAPDGFVTPEEREQQKAEAERLAQAEAEQERISVEARRSFQERKKAEEAAAQEALHEQYGITQHEIDLWQQVLSELKMQLTDDTFHTYVAGTLLLSLQDAHAVIGLANARTKDWVENRLAKRIGEILAMRLDGRKVTLTFETLEQHVVAS